MRNIFLDFETATELLSVNSTTRCESEKEKIDMNTYEALGSPCVRCGATESVIPPRFGRDSKVVPNQQFGGHTVCRDCFYSGAGFQTIYDELVQYCASCGVTLQVWQTGGGCQSLVVQFGDGYDCYFGMLDGDLASDELGVAIHDSEGEYEDEWTYEVADLFPVPETQDVASVAEWICTVTRHLRASVMPQTHDFEIVIKFSSDRNLTKAECDLLLQQCVVQVDEPVDEFGDDADITTSGMRAYLSGGDSVGARSIIEGEVK